ncbi:uncharacterized protein YktA (UPF0223 family) [Enterococcus lemanii]|jgi:uncharacterized protein YktA (UPF0223 family)|nr:uncharacterized protein YktA (UPF0223 family) [Enterococcus lemanii]
MNKMKDYQYPLDLEWSTEEMVQVMALWQALEQAYEKGIDNQQFLEKYQAFKKVVRSIGEERRLGREFEETAGYSLYQTLQNAKKNEKKILKMKG